MLNTRIYRIWRTMKQRCTNPKNISAKEYLERWITYCDEWENFEAFYKDMWGTYKEWLTLERIDNNLALPKPSSRIFIFE